jgi:hypothetical protein
LQFEWDANPTTSIRTTTVTITCGSVNIPVAITQDGAFTLTTVVDPAGTGLTTGDGIYVLNQSATVTAVPNATYFFEKWTIDGSEVSTSATYTFNVTSDITLTANFAKLPGVTNLKAMLNESTNQTVLTWDAVPGATEYLIYADNVKIDSTAQTTYTHANPTLTRYCVTVKSALGISDPVCVESIERLAQTITWNQVLGDMGYRATPIALTATSSGSLSIAYTSSDPTVATISGNMLTMVGAGATTITASQAGNDEYKPAADVSKSLAVFMINPVENLQGVHSESTDRTTLSWDEPTGGTIVNGYLIYINGTKVDSTQNRSYVHRRPAEGITEYCVVVKTPIAPTEEKCVEVFKRYSQTITWEQSLRNLPFGSTPVALTATSSNGLDITYASNDPTVAAISGNMLTMLQPGAATITASQAGNSDYKPAEDVAQVLTVFGIDPVGNLQGVYNLAADKTTLTWNAPGGGTVAKKYYIYRDDVLADSTTALTYVHSHPNEANTNYCVKVKTAAGLTAPQCVQVWKPRQQTITWNQSLEIPYSATDATTLTATAGSGLPITYTSSNPAVATINGNLLTTTGVGTVVITALQAGDDTYAPASMPRTLTVNNIGITLDAFAINNGDVMTSHKTVTLNLTITGGLPTHYMASENSDFGGEHWVTYNGAMPLYTFKTDLHGYRTVYVKLMNEINTTDVLADDIYYKAAPAKIALSMYGINNGARQTANRTVTLNHVVENGVALWYSASENYDEVGQTWLPYTAAPEFELSAGKGTKTVYMAVANEEEMSDIVAASIILDESITVEFQGLTAKMYPNPVNDFVNVVVENEVDAVQVTVYSITGQVHLLRTFQGNTFQIDMSNYPTGVLLVKLASGKDYVIKRIVKQ